MATTLTAEDAKQSLTAHLVAKGVEIFTKYGGSAMGWSGLQQLLLDRAYVRYPCEIAFDATSLEAGEFAHPVPKSDRPEDGFTMLVHPAFEADLDRVPLLVLYQLVAVNYGEFASARDAEHFGAAALGLTCDEYYDQLCEFSDRVGGVGASLAEHDHGHEHEHDPAGGCSCGGGGCH
jgi:hypothetical protein